MTQNTLNGEVSVGAILPIRVMHPAPDAARSDAGLMELIYQRQEPAPGVLYDRYNQLLYTIALRITGDRNIAEEVIQDVFTAVWQSAGGFHTGGNVKAWLIGITRHRGIDATRTRHFRGQKNVMPFDESHAVDTATETEAQVIATLEREQVQGALADLPSFQRTAIELAYYAGYTCAEIAIHTGVPLGTVKTRLRLGLSKLRLLLFIDHCTI